MSKTLQDVKNTETQVSCLSDCALEIQKSSKKANK